MSEREVSDDGLPMVSVENFIESDFEEKFKLYAQQFGSAGTELLRGVPLRDVDFDIPCAGDMVRVYVDTATGEYLKIVEKGDAFEDAMVERMLNPPGETPVEKEEEEEEEEERALLGVRKKKLGAERKFRTYGTVMKKYKDCEKELYTARLQNGLKRKDQHQLNKQRLCSKLMLKLDKSLRVSVQQHKDHANAMNTSDIIKLFEIVKQCATGRGAQSVAILLFQLIQLKQKSDSVEDFEMYVKEFKNVVIDIMKIGDAEKVLEQFFNAKFVHGLRREPFKEHLALPLSQTVWPFYQDLSELLLRVVRTNRGFNEMNESRAQKKGSSDGTIIADMSRTMLNIPDEFRNMCFKCGKKNHRASECSVEEVYCSKCKKKGNHLEKFHQYLVRSGNNDGGGGDKNYHGGNNGKAEDSKFNQSKRKVFKVVRRPVANGNKHSISAKSANIGGDDASCYSDQQEEEVEIHVLNNAGDEDFDAEDIEAIFSEYGSNDNSMIIRTNATTVVSSEEIEEEELEHEEGIKCCSSDIVKVKQDILKIRIAADTGCIGDGHVVNRRDLFSELAKSKKRFRIQSYDGNVSITRMSGNVVGLGQSVLAENAPNCLMNVNKFCADFGYHYTGNDTCMKFYDRNNNLIVTASDVGDGFLSFEYGELLSGQRKTVSVNTVETHQRDVIQVCPVKALIDPQFTAEQISRAKEAQKLCSLMGHPGDKAILRALMNGNFASNNLTTQDLVNCRKLFGPCIACIEAKMNAPHATPSDTPPASTIGEKIFCDLIFFSEGCFGGYTCALFSVDEKSLYRVVVGLKNKGKDKLFEGFKTLIATYTSYGHVVKHIIMDDEAAFNAMRQPLAELGILATVTPAGLHNRKCERYIQTHIGRERSIKADLPYEIPAKLDYHLAIWTVTLSNQTPNFQVQYTTPHELFTGKKPFIPVYKFGQTGLFYAPRTDTEQKAQWGIFLGHRDNLENSYLAYVPLRDQFYSMRKFHPLDTYPTEWNYKPRLRRPDPKSKTDQLSTLKQELFKPQELPKASPQPLNMLESHVSGPPDPFISVLNNNNKVPEVDISSLPQPVLPVVPSVVNLPNIAPVLIPQNSFIPQEIPSKTVVVPTVAPKKKPVLVVATPAQEGATMMPISSSVPPASSVASAPASHHEGSSIPATTIPSKEIRLDPNDPGNIISQGRSSRVRRPNSRYFQSNSASVLQEQMFDKLVNNGEISRPINGDIVSVNIARTQFAQYLEEKASDVRYWLRHSRAMATVRINQMSVSAALRDSSKLQMTKNAIAGELKGLIDTKSFRPIQYVSLTPEERHKNVVGTHMFIEDKYLSTGEFEKRKARLVIHGNQQDPSTIGETRAPTVNPISVCACLARAAAMKECDIETADVVQAFLTTPYKEEDKQLRGKVIVRVDDQAVIEELLTQMPELKRFIVVFKEGRRAMFFELDTYVYGLAAAAREFNVVLDEVLTKKLGFRVSEADPCVYLKDTEFGIHTLCIHVDDLLSIAPNRRMQNAFMEAFGGFLKIKRHRDKILSYTGMTIARQDDGSIKVTQDHYVQELVKKFGDGIHGRTVKTPAGNDLIASDSDDEATKLNDKEKKFYLSLIMSLMYLARLTRSDILFATTYLATKSTNPTKGDLRKAKRIVKYISGTASIGITFLYENNMELMVHADASHLLHPEGFGHTGYIVTVGGSIVYARSAKQKMQTLSSTESELIALQEASTLVVWMRYLLNDIGYPVSGPTIVTQDNQSAIHIAEQGGNFQRTKHLVGRFNYLRERIVNGDLVIKYRPTERMPADYLTKPVSEVLLHRHLKAINVC